MPLTLVTGGVRSGKSRLAVRLAARTNQPVVFVATATAGDEEMKARIERHQSDRPTDWTTIEERLDLDKSLSDAPSDACVIVDCLNLWVSSLMGDGFDDDEIEARAHRAAALAADREGSTIAVTNEVGWSVHPQTSLGRRFVEVLGRVNRLWSARSTDAFLVVAGRVISLGSPVEVEIDDG